MFGNKMKIRILILFFGILSFNLNAQVKSQVLYYNQLKFAGLENANSKKLNSGLNFSMPDEGAPLKKSVGKALLYSLILPGAGEFYVDEPGFGKLFLGIEILAWSSFLFNDHYFSSLQKDYKSYARLHAGVAQNSKNAQYWIDIGKFDDIYAYNDQRRRDRRIDAIYEESPNTIWNWDSKDNRFKYDAKRLKAVDIKNREVYFITTILLNHIVSAINAVRLTRKYNRNLASQTFEYRFVLNTVDPYNKYFGIALAKSF